MFIYFWERGGERERERAHAYVAKGQRESQVGSMLWAQSPEAGLDPRNHEIVTWEEIKSESLNQLSHPDTPKNVYYKP